MRIDIYEDDVVGIMGIDYDTLVNLIHHLKTDQEDRLLGLLNALEAAELLISSQHTVLHVKASYFK